MAKRQARPTRAAWEAARTAFATMRATPEEIAKKLGVRPATVRRRIRDDGWGVETFGASEQTRSDAARIREFEALLDRELTALAERLGEPGADDERRARALSGLVRVFEKVMEMKVSMDERSAASRAVDDGKKDEKRTADELRAEIARRLDRVLAARGAAPLAEEPDAG